MHRIEASRSVFSQAVLAIGVTLEGFALRMVLVSVVAAATVLEIVPYLRTFSCSKRRSAVRLLRVHDQFVGDFQHFAWTVLALAVNAHQHALQLEFEYGGNAFDALDHAGGDGGEQQFGGVERVCAASGISIQLDLGTLADGDAAVGVDALRADIVRVCQCAPR
jgi:hypothetical protein